MEIAFDMFGCLSRIYKSNYFWNLAFQLLKKWNILINQMKAL